MEEIIKKLNYYRNEYYNNHKSIISDREYDDLYDKLVQMEQESGIIMSNSPTQSVGYEVLDGLEKIKHSHEMKSLDKTKDINNLKLFMKNNDCILSLKCDGLTLLLTYENGKLIQAETRGDGKVGQIVTSAAKQFKNIPLEIPYKEHFEIEGEAIIDYSTFEKININKEYKNPRNLASGTLSLLNTKDIKERELSFIAWKVVTNIGETYIDRFNIAKDLGFTIVPYVRVENIELEIEQLKLKAKENEIPIDGLVLTINDIEYGLSLGETDHAPKHSIAYKFYDEEYKTTLKNIEWTMGRTGVLTPVALYEDIEIEGTICNRASLHNVSIMKELLGDPFINQKIYVYKSNMIIPQISKAEKGVIGENCYTNAFIIPEMCPVCGGKTSIHKDNDSEVLYCDNPSCEGKLINRIDHFCSKKGLDIKGLSKATLEKLLDWGCIGDIQSIFELKEFRNEWIKKPGFGVKSVDNILEAIEKAKNTTLDKIIAAAGIPEIGSRVAKDLANHYSSWSEFRTETNFLQYDGIGEIMNNNLLSFDYTEMDYIVEHYLKTEKNIDIINIENNSIKDKIFCVTGKTHIFKNRTELTADIESKGGKVVSAISSKVNYLINNDINSTSAKNKAAQAANIPILTEEDYITLNLKK